MYLPVQVEKYLQNVLECNLYIRTCFIGGGRLKGLVRLLKLLKSSGILSSAIITSSSGLLVTSLAARLVRLATALRFPSLQSSLFASYSRICQLR